MLNDYFSELEKAFEKVTQGQARYPELTRDPGTLSKRVQEGMAVGRDLRSIAIVLSFKHTLTWVRTCFLKKPLRYVAKAIGHGVDAARKRA